jgi:DNA-binding response OmpR family regulator
MPKEHILVVEDEEGILELLRYNLAKEGFRVTGVLSGEEADIVAGPAMGPDIFGVRA